jgi:hypothetical protein
LGLFESDIQELIYDTLVADSTLGGLLGADVSDTRIYLAWPEGEITVDGEKPAYMVIETMPAEAPIRIGSNVDDWAQRYCLHVFAEPEERELRGEVEERLRLNLHRKKFVTESHIIYDVFEDGKEDVLEEGGLFDHKYFTMFKFLLKN